MTDAIQNYSRQVLDHLTTAVLALDAGLRVQFMNPAAEEMFGLSARQAGGHPLSRLFLNSAELETIAGRVLEKQTAVAGRDLELVPRETPTLPLAEGAATLTSAGAASPSGVVIVALRAR